MAKSNAWETELLELLFNNEDVAGIGDAGGLRGSVVAGSLYLSLHTSSVGEGGTQATNEISYTGYGRKAIARSVAGFTVTNDNVVNAADIDFGKMTAGAGGTATHWALGDDLSGAGKVRYHGAITGALATTPIISGVIPRIEAGSLSITES